MTDPFTIYIAVLVTVAELTILGFVLGIRKEQRRLAPLAPLLEFARTLTPIQIQGLQVWLRNWVNARLAGVMAVEDRFKERGHG